MGEKMDRRKKYTRMVLKDSLIELLAEKPIASVTVKEICELADVNRSTFYTHYADQYDLLTKIENEIIDDMNAYLSSYSFTKEDEALLMTQKLVEYITDKKLMFETLLNENGDSTFEKRLMEVARRFVMKNTMEGTDLDEQFSSYLSTYIISGAIHVIKEWIASGMEESPREIAELINHFSNRGLSYLQE
ncbi:TetR/AcrR family transcriptional regulator [Alkalibacillus haloalkaliphilus]|uniref:TetR family transcriptional regulator n=1 Tax=Alkalibacillus haloalkaliphilus TaxID=94136 RepID=A0A511W5X4_9BACI|nr:TetR-like C-terminal domain-containing protein [Alkalibacillus haloalkaliphilus]GEN45453.1 TetR family transcriptional regulator [Alkalibacillus haloalkaliphilus]